MISSAVMRKSFIPYQRRPNAFGVRLHLVDESLIAASIFFLLRIVIVESRWSVILACSRLHRTVALSLLLLRFRFGLTFAVWLVVITLSIVACCHEQHLHPFWLPCALPLEASPFCSCLPPLMNSLQGNNFVGFASIATIIHCHLISQVGSVEHTLSEQVNVADGGALPVPVQVRHPDVLSSIDDRFVVGTQRESLLESFARCERPRRRWCSAERAVSASASNSSSSPQAECEERAKLLHQHVVNVAGHGIPNGQSQTRESRSNDGFQMMRHERREIFSEKRAKTSVEWVAS